MGWVLVYYRLKRKARTDASEFTAKARNVKPKERIIKGIAASDGIVIGKAFVFSTFGGVEGFHVPVYPVAEERMGAEVARFEAALDKSRIEVRHAQQKLAEKIGLQHAKIFDAQLLLLDDRIFLNEVIARMKKERRNAESVFTELAARCIKTLAMSDEYFRERSADIRDVTHRVLHHLAGKTLPTLANMADDVIVVACDLSPSDTAVMHRERVVGIVTQIGGPTSHTSIMARALEVPAVVGAPDIVEMVKDGAPLIVDGTEGIVIVNPTAARIEEYQQRNVAFKGRKTHLLRLRDKLAVTTDDKAIHLMANIEIPEEARHAIDSGAEGVGLYRTEFFFLNRADLPSEEEQFEVYAAVVRQCSGMPVTIRTLDLGGDKFVSSLKLPREMNPFLGWRAIRMCLERKDMFKAQLRAILRAGAEGTVQIMFPMIATIGEVRAAKALLEESRAELRKAGTPCAEHLPVGVMIEIPSAALAADVIAREVDFFSIGTNDLIQYTMAIDRVNEKTATMYDPLNIGVLRLIKLTVDAAHGIVGNGGHKPIPVAVCGEMASNPLLAYLLVGMGVDELSTVSTAIPKNKEMIRSISFSEAQQVAGEALNLPSSDEILALIMRHIPAV